MTRFSPAPLIIAAGIFVSLGKTSLLHANVCAPGTLLRLGQQVISARALERIPVPEHDVALTLDAVIRTARSLGPNPDRDDLMNLGDLIIEYLYQRGVTATRHRSQFGLDPEAIYTSANTRICGLRNFLTSARGFSELDNFFEDRTFENRLRALADSVPLRTLPVQVSPIRTTPPLSQGLARSREDYSRTGRPLHALRLGTYPSSFLHIPELRGRMVLDLGCGRGDFVENLRDLGVSAFGVDRDMPAQQMSKPHFIQADMRNTPLAGNQFDFIYASWTLFSDIYELNNNPVVLPALREAHRLLKVGGRLRISPIHDLRRLQSLVNQVPGLQLRQTIMTPDRTVHEVPPHWSVEIIRTQ